MASFAERSGLRPRRCLVQRDSLDEGTRLELWNALFVLRQIFADVSNESYRTDETESNVLNAIWAWELKRARDERPADSGIWTEIKKTILAGPWFDVLDLIEATMRYLERYKTHLTDDAASALVEALNCRFERYLVGYRFIGGEITPIDSSAEAEAVSSAIDDVDAIAGARHSLERAVALLADRAAPDYPNSIKESISAVEAVIRRLTGEGTLGAGLKKLEKSGVSIHPALLAAWSKMYGWTSEADGIRHAGIDAADADQSLAKYMLVTCSAFVSLLTEQGRKASLL
jgi:hypothetical protein